MTSPKEEPRRIRVLFVCSRNRLRSPTAEEVFRTWEGIETASAGTDEKADQPLDSEIVQWADLIFVMQQSHRSRLTKKFGPWLRDKRVIVLNIPDDYAYMEPALVQLLERTVGPLLMQRGGRSSDTSQTAFPQGQE